jgi:hypothetical protein
MYIEQANDYIISTSIPYNIDDWLYLYDKYELEFEMYRSKFDRPLGLEVVYDNRLLQEPVIKELAHYFKDFGLKFSMNDSMPGSGQAGFQLVRTNLVENPEGVMVHQDAFRSAGLIVPLSFPQRIQWYENGEHVYDYEYTGITFINAGGKEHGVDYVPDCRYQFQFDIHVPWADIPSLIESL